MVREGKAVEDHRSPRRWRVEPCPRIKRVTIKRRTTGRPESDGIAVGIYEGYAIGFWIP